MKKNTAKKLVKVTEKLEEGWNILEDLINNVIDIEVENAVNYAEDHENSERAQEKAEQLEEEQTELNDILEELETLKNRLEEIIENTLYN